MMSAVLVRYLFLITPFTLNLSFMFSIVIFHFFAILSPLLASSLFWLFILWKVLWVYLWEKRGSTATLLLWTEYLQHSDQSLIELKKWCDWSSIIMICIYYLIVICGPKSKRWVLLYVITQSYYNRCLLEGLMLKLQL